MGCCYLLFLAQGSGVEIRATLHVVTVTFRCTALVLLLNAMFTALQRLFELDQRAFLNTTVQSGVGRTCAYLALHC